MPLWAIQNIHLALFPVSKHSAIFTHNIILEYKDLWFWSSTSVVIFKTYLHKTLSNLIRILHWPNFEHLLESLSPQWLCDTVISWVRAYPVTAPSGFFPYVLNKKKIKNFKKSLKNSRACCSVSFPSPPNSSIIIVPHPPMLLVVLKIILCN